MRHAPSLNGTVEGSVQQMLGESVTLRGGGTVTGDLLVPGLPAIRINGNPRYGGTTNGTGSTAPSNYQVTLSGNAALRHVVCRTDAVALPVLTVPAAPSGTRSVALNNAGQSPGDFSTLRNLTLDGNAGQLALPAGIYGDVTASGNSGITLGVAGATQPAVYFFQRLTFNGPAQLQVVGPVVVTVASGLATNGPIGSPVHPSWLTLNVYSGGVTLNGGGELYGYLSAPNGTVTINGNGKLVGGLACDRLALNGNGLLRLIAPPANLPPQVSLTFPANGATFTAPASLTLRASASDSDGVVARVEFYRDMTKIAEDLLAPYEAALSGLPAGSYTFTARAFDGLGAFADSTPATIAVQASNPVPNQPPAVALTLPLSGTLFNAPATVPLVATASDPDGMIAKVEFFQGSAKLGESAQAPFAFTWTGMLPGSYALSAKATDNLGASATTPATLVTVQAALPQSIDFEAAEGYQLGSLHGQGGWTVTGTADVTDAAALRGVRAVVLAATTPATKISYVFPASAGQPIVFVDVFAKMIVGGATTPGSLLEVEGARVTLLPDAAQGEVAVFNSDGFGGGTWQRTGFKIALTATGQTAGWLRLTVREDFVARKWDLYVSGRLVAADLGFADPAAAGFTRLALTGVATAPTVLDDLFAGFDNPLFPDADKDGLDDAWEAQHGFNLALNDRAGDPDGDGWTNVQEYQLGTDPNNYYNGTLPELTSLVNPDQRPGPGGSIAVRVSRANGTILANAPLAFEVASGGLQLSPVPGGSNLSTMLAVRSDAQGVATAYVTYPASPAAASVVLATARSGTQTKTLSLTLAPPIVDSDGDGLHDPWETNYLGTLNHRASDDPGGVGRTLLLSQQQNLNPWPAAPVISGLQVWYRSDLGTAT
ncbi:MAG: Ig-like domain-containing protein, partial [Verrucomicrobia bacterium]|nr:Ig-like domain-containing protein [Verrucomicrobiota bacterium]